MIFDLPYKKIFLEAEDILETHAFFTLMNKLCDGLYSLELYKAHVWKGIELTEKIVKAIERGKQALNSLIEVLHSPYKTYERKIVEDILGEKYIDRIIKNSEKLLQILGSEKISEKECEELLGFFYEIVSKMLKEEKYFRICRRMKMQAWKDRPINRNMAELKRLKLM